MKAVLRGIVSMAFSTIEDQKIQNRVPSKPKVNPVVSRPITSPPTPVPADEIYKPLSSSDPVPFGAVTKIESTTDNSSFTDQVLIQRFGAADDDGASVSGHFIFDVTDTSTHKVRFSHRNFTYSADLSQGNTNYNLTYFTFTRLGDT